MTSQKFLSMVVSSINFLPWPRKICLPHVESYFFLPFNIVPIYLKCVFCYRGLFIFTSWGGKATRDQRIHGVQKKGKSRGQGPSYTTLCLCVCVSEWTCPRVRTLTLAWAASLWSRWLLACLSFSSRSARRATQREVNPSFSSSRARTTCRSSSSFLLHSVFISWMREVCVCVRRRAGGREGQINNGDGRRWIEKSSDSNWENGKKGSWRNTKRKATHGVEAEMNM